MIEKNTSSTWKKLKIGLVRIGGINSTHLHSDFGLRIPLISYCRVKEFDILIQKEKKEEDRFIKVQYFQIINGKPEFLGMDNNKAKWFLGTTILDYIIKHNKLPFGCHYIKEFKNGNCTNWFYPDQMG